MSRVRDWCKLDEDWHDDEVLEAIADEHGPAVMALWPMLVAMAYKGSDHRTNPAGTIRITKRKLAAATRHNADDVAAALAGLVDGELITIDEGRLGTLRITLTHFEGWQTPKGSAADRKAKSRDASRENVPKCHTSVTDASHDVPEASLEERREEERREETAAAEGTPPFAHEGAPARGGADSSSRMVGKSIDLLIAASAAGTHRSVWEEHVELLTTVRGVSPSTLLDAAVKMQARVAGGQPPFAFDRGVTFLRGAIQRLKTDDAQLEHRATVTQLRADGAVDADRDAMRRQIAAAEATSRELDAQAEELRRRQAAWKAAQA